MVSKFYKRFESASLVEKIILANALVFAASLLLNPVQVDWRLDPFRFLAPSTAALSAVGATGVVPVVVEGHWWTLITANYVHVGALHLALNMAVLYSLGRIASLIYGDHRFFLLYTVGGITAMYASVWARIPITAGASGSLCAIVGAILYADWKAGGHSIVELARSVGIWVVVLAVSGFVIPNVNNWAHFAGLAAGVVLGLLLWRRRAADPVEAKAFAAGATVCTIATLGAFLLMLVA